MRVPAHSPPYSVPDFRGTVGVLDRWGAAPGNLPSLKSSTHRARLRRVGSPRLPHSRLRTRRAAAGLPEVKTTSTAWARSEGVRGIGATTKDYHSPKMQNKSSKEELCQVWQFDKNGQSLRTTHTMSHAITKTSVTLTRVQSEAQLSGTPCTTP